MLFIISFMHFISFEELFIFLKAIIITKFRKTENVLT